MTKITITSKEKNIEGTIKTKVVKPFGGSSHVILEKEDIGKYVEVIFPKETKFAWMLEEDDREKVMAICQNIINNSPTIDKLAMYKLASVRNIGKDCFSEDDLAKVIGTLNQSSNPEASVLAKKIIETYSLKL
jgi:putative transposon-encoded protein